MDPILIDVYTEMHEHRHCSTDDILCEPELRNEFLEATRSRMGSERPEGVILKRLANLRKKSKLPSRRFDRASVN
jgi:hypothetical protein